MRVLRRLVLRSFGIFNRLRKQQGGSKRIDKGQSALNVCSQVSDSDLLGNKSTGYQSSSLGAQSNSYQAIDVAQSGGLFKINEGGMRNVGNSGLGMLNQGAGIAGIAHDGSYRFFKWDNAKGCMVPFKPSTPLKQRFQRSFDAFIHSWRLG